MEKYRNRKQFSISWKPENIYYFKSGNYAGRSMPELMFEDYFFLQNELKLIVNKKSNLGFVKRFKADFIDYLNYSHKIKDKSELHKHLEFYLAAGERLVSKKSSKIICPYCRKEPAQYLALIDNASYGFDVSAEHVCCKNNECKTKLKRGVSRNIRLFKFSLFEAPSKYKGRSYYSDVYKENIIKFFTEVFGLPEKITAEIAFQFFLS